MVRKMPVERCKCYHTFIAKNGAVYSGMRCSRALGHKGRCKWASIWYNWCDFASRDNNQGEN